VLRARLQSRFQHIQRRSDGISIEAVLGGTDANSIGSVLAQSTRSPRNSLNDGGSMRQQRTGGSTKCGDLMVAVASFTRTNGGGASMNDQAR
jgi:hypothetical protein